MLRSNAVGRIFLDAGSGTPARAEGTTWLPSPTNSSNAASVASVVIIWLLATLIALLLAAFTIAIHFMFTRTCSGIKL